MVSILQDPHTGDSRVRMDSICCRTTSHVDKPHTEECLACASGIAMQYARQTIIYHGCVDVKQCVSMPQLSVDDKCVQVCCRAFQQRHCAQT